MSTSKLQRETKRMLHQRFRAYIFDENVRPDWLVTRDGARLELDFYCDELGVAIEVQGEQHARYIPFFHLSPENYKRRLSHDQFKKERCQNAGIDLYEVWHSHDIENVFSKIYKKTENRLSDEEIKELMRQYIDRRVKGIKKQIRNAKKQMVGLSVNDKEYKKLRKAIVSLNNAIDKVTEREARVFTTEVLEHLYNSKPIGGDTEKP